MEGLYEVKLENASYGGTGLQNSEVSFDGGSMDIKLKSLWESRPNWLRAFHQSKQGDLTFTETIANVLTSVPFIVIGLQAPRKTPTTTMYANSLIGVGVASSMFHMSRGKLRKYLRWGDYTMIAASTVCLSRALKTDNSNLLLAFSAILLPFQPFLVAGVNTGMMEVQFAERACKDKQIRKAYAVHAMSSLIGMTLFLVDDIHPNTPFLHSAWHLSAALGVSTCNKLLN